MKDTMDVVAVKMGIYKGSRRRAGSVFALEDRGDFRGSWMRPAEEAREVETEQERARREHIYAVTGRMPRLKANAADYVNEFENPTARVRTGTHAPGMGAQPEGSVDPTVDPASLPTADRDVL